MLLHGSLPVPTAPPQPTAAFIETLTLGTLSLDQSGALTGDPAVLAWLDGFRRQEVRS